MPGTHEGQELAFVAKAGLPDWATDIFGLVESYDEMDGMENGVEDDDVVLPKEADDLLIQLFENFSVQDNLDSHGN